MYIIKIPKNKNKYDFVSKMLKNLQNEFDDYEFFNCTVSPIEKYTYFEHNGMYYRKMISNICVIVNESDFVDSYEKDKLKSQGFTLQEYVEMCLLFELEQIMVLPRLDMQIDNLVPLVAISICPDGLNEIHFSGQNILINEMIASLRSSQFLA